MSSTLDALLGIVSLLYAVLIIAAVYALGTNDNSLFQLVAVLSIGLTGIAVWTAFLARRREWV